MKRNSLAPIILFTYNRPWHTKQTLNALMQNKLASESVLHIFSDGSKLDATIDQINKINEVRQIIHSVKGFKEVVIKESKVNNGLANSIIAGVSEVISQYGKVIVLEDDLITSPYFLQYMNSGLDFYESYNSVFSICADRPPYKFFEIPKDYEYDVFVSLRSYSTGWATWIDRWKKVSWSLEVTDDFFNKPEQIKAFNRGGEDLSKLILLQKEAKIDSWAIRFVLAHFVNHAVAILPCVSYVDNIGFDGTGVHSPDNEENFRKNVFDAPSIPRFLNILYEDRRIINSFYSAYFPKKRPLWKKIINRLSRILGFKNIYVIKKKIYA